MLRSRGMGQHDTGDAVTAGAVTGSVSLERSSRIVTITATEGWSVPDWNTVARALDAHDDYFDWDCDWLDDGSEQWRIVYRRTDEQP